MTEAEILGKIRVSDLPQPKPRDVGAFYAAWLATVYGRLTPEQQEQAIQLGAVIHKRTLRMVPVLGSVGDDGEITGLNLGHDGPLGPKPCF